MVRLGHDVFALLVMIVAAGPGQPLRVAMFDGPGVSAKGFAAARTAFEKDGGVALRIVDAQHIRDGVLDDVDVVVFMGGDGARQGRTLGAEGIERVRAFVNGGGGYVGVCAGAYLAMQGPERYHKLRLVAARNLSGERWKRGIAAAFVAAVGSDEKLELHFANGPLFARAPADGLRPYVPVALFESDLHKLEHGTRPGEMPGTPAILVAGYGSGRVLLFSPHPALERPGVPRPDLMTAGVRWLATPGDIAETTTFADVFE